MPINFDPNSLNNVFDKNFGAGAYNSGLSNARKAAQLKTQSSFAKQNFLKAVSDYQAKQKQDQSYMAKYGMTKAEYDAQQAQKKANGSFDSALNYWNNKKSDLQKKGAYKTANDLLNDPQAMENLKNQGYSVSKLVDAAYQVASNGQFKSKKAYDQFATALDRNNTNKKANQDSIDLYIQKAKAEEANKKQQQLKAANSKQMNWYDKLNAGGQRIGDQFLRTVFGNNFANWNNQQDKELAQYELKKNPNNTKAIKALIRDNAAYSNASTTGEKLLNYTGGTFGNIAPFLVGDGLLGVAEKGVAGATKGTAQKALTRLVNPSSAVNNPFGKAALRGAASGIVGSGVAMGAHNVMSGETYTPEQVALNTLKTGLMGAAIPPALMGVGKGFQAAAGKTMRGLLPSDRQLADILGSGMKQEKLPAPQERLRLPGPSQPLRLEGGSPSPLGLPEPQRALPAPVQDPLGLPSPQLRLNAPNPIQNSLETLLNTGKQINGLQSPIPQMPTTMRLAQLKNMGTGFGYNTKLEPKARGSIANGSIPRYAKEALNNKADKLLNDISKLQSKPSNYFENRLLQIQKDMQNSRQTTQGLGGNTSVDELYQNTRNANDPGTFNDLVRMNQLETNWLKNSPVQGPKTASDIMGPLQGPVEPPRSISRLATLDEMVNRLQGMVPPKQVQEPLPLNFKKTLVAKSNHGQEKPLIFKKTIQPPTAQTTPKNVSDSPLFLNPNSLKPENVLKSTATKKTLDKMSKEELQTVYQELQTKKETLTKSKTKASKKQLAAVEADLKKVNDFLLKSDLQKFAEGSKKKAPIPPKERKAQKQAVANFDEKAKKAGIPSQVRKEVKQTEDIGKILKGTKNINEMTDKLPKETADKVKTALNMVEELKKTKDILPTQTLTKNIYELADKLPKEIGDSIKSQLDKAKVAHVNNIEQRTNTLYDKVVKELGIKKGSKESALVQDFGEKTLGKKYLRQRGIDPSKLSEEELSRVNLQQLKKQHPEDWQKIVAADDFFKQDYKKMIAEVNATVKKIYPNNPEKLVHIRKDYYHHFNELDGFEGFKNMIQNSSAIDPHLAGISAHTKPNSKWQGFKQMRKNGAYKSDAVGGYLRYLQAASHSTHIDPMIKVLRNTADQIASATQETKNLNNIKTALEVHADNFAGKTNPVDRLFQDHVVGRKIMNVANVVNSHIKKNMILGNLGSALGQIGNVPLAIGKAKQFSAKGALDTLEYAASHLPGGNKSLSAPIKQSQFLKERYSNEYFKRFDTGFLKKPEKMAAWLIETADKSGTYFTWNSMYRKGLAQGVKDPIKYADAETRHVVAGRGVGEVPIAQRAKITQLVAPFTLEVGNQWKVLGKQMSEKDFAGIVTFLAASYGLNQAVVRVKGSNASYDPIGALIEGYQRKDGNAVDKTKGALASLSGETIGNIPGGNYIPQMLGLASDQAKQTLFGDRSPDRFGTGVGVASTLFKPATDAVQGNWKQAGKDALALSLPFGGNQAKKTVGGIEALVRGGSYNNKGKLQYPVDTNNPSDVIHSLLFGAPTTAQGRDYYGNKRQPLSDKQTAIYQNSPNKQDYFNNIQYQRQIKAIQKQISDIQKDPSMPITDKQKQILSLMNKLQNLQK